MITTIRFWSESDRKPIDNWEDEILWKWEKYNSKADYGKQVNRPCRKLNFCWRTKISKKQWMIDYYLLLSKIFNILKCNGSKYYRIFYDSTKFYVILLTFIEIKCDYLVLSNFRRHFYNASNKFHNSKIKHMESI